MTRWWVVPAIIAGSVVAGFVAGRWAAPPEVATRTETREVVRNVESKVNAEATVRVVEVAGPTVTRWRTAPAAPGCPAVNEVIHESGPVQRIVEEATKTAMESKAQEATHESTTTMVALRPDWSVHLLGGVAPLHLRDREWVAGMVVTRRIGGPFAVGAFGLVRSDMAGSAVGLTLGASW